MAGLHRDLNICHLIISEQTLGCICGNLNQIPSDQKCISYSYSKKMTRLSRWWFELEIAIYKVIEVFIGCFGDRNLINTNSNTYISGAHFM